MDILEAIRTKAFAEAPSLPADLQGWLDKDNFMSFFIRATTAVPTPLILEVGSWKGLSASTMASYMREKCINGRVVAIDTWLGSPEHLREYAHIFNRETLFKQFISNVQHQQLDKYIYPFPISSTQGGHFLEQNQVRADVVYIDAGHEYEAVLLDIQVYWRLLKPGGYMILDDYTWAGVKQAVDQFCKQNSLSCEVRGNVACIIKRFT